MSNCDPNCAGGTVLTLSLVNDTDRLAKDRHNFAEPPRRCACCRSSSFGQSLPVYRRMVSERAGRRAYQIRRSSPAMRFSCQESVSSSNDPSHTPDVLNYLINSFLRPTPSPYIPGGSVFLQFGREVIGPLISLLPPQLQAVVGSAFAKIGAALAQGLSHLPGNLGLGAMYVGSAAADLPSALLNLNFDIHTLGTALGQAIGGGYTPPAPPGSPPLLPTTGLAGWLGFTPTVLLATLQAAVDDPSNIPGLASYLVYSVLGPPSTLFPPPLGAIPPFPDFPGFPGLPYPFGSYSLFVTTFAPIIAGLEAVLPAPLADALASVSLALNDVLGKALGILPDPINPFVALLPFSALNANVADQLVTAKAAVDPFPDADLGDVFDAVQGAAEGLLASAEQLPAGLQILVKTIAARPELAPALLVGVVNAQIDGFERALAPVFRALIGTLPRDLRLPVGQALGEVSAGLQDVQHKVQDAVTPGDPVKQLSGPQNLSIAGDNKGAATEGPAVTKNDHKNFVNLDISALNPFNQDRKGSDMATQVGDNGTSVKRPASHEFGIGKTPVRDLIKRITSGLDHQGGAGDTAAPAAS